MTRCGPLARTSRHLFPVFQSQPHAFFRGHRPIHAMRRLCISIFHGSARGLGPHPAPEFAGFLRPDAVPVFGGKEADDAEEGDADRGECDAEGPEGCGALGHIGHAEDGGDECEGLVDDSQYMISVRENFLAH